MSLDRGARSKSPLTPKAAAKKTKAAQLAMMYAQKHEVIAAFGSLAHQRTRAIKRQLQLQLYSTKSLDFFVFTISLFWLDRNNLDIFPWQEHTKYQHVISGKAAKVKAEEKRNNVNVPSPRPETVNENENEIDSGANEEQVIRTSHSDPCIRTKTEDKQPPTFFGDDDEEPPQLFRVVRWDSLITHFVGWVMCLSNGGTPTLDPPTLFNHLLRDHRTSFQSDVFMNNELAFHLRVSPQVMGAMGAGDFVLLKTFANFKELKVGSPTVR